MKKHIFSQNFINEIIQISSGFFSSKNFELLLSSFETETVKYFFTLTSEANLLRIIKSVIDKISFFNDCLKYPKHTEIVIAIAANSNYLTDIVVRNPEYLSYLFRTNFSDLKITGTFLEKKLNCVLKNFSSFKTKLNVIKLFKRRYILLIGINDILRNYDLETVTKYLSYLAKVINKILFNLCHKEIEKNYKIEINRNRYCLLSLGKLGGRELNYSSDTDFILFYDKNSVIRKINKDYFEILTEATKLFINSASNLEENGFLYRIDFRLRPDGKNSPLCRTFSDIIKYYETRGEDWERQMLIKADFAGGNKNLFKKFINYLSPFIYPSYFMNSPLKHIATMKYNIEKYSTTDKDIKKSKGGIRDIEFSVQALQMLNGASNKELCTGNTLEALLLLNKFNLLSLKEYKIFYSAYILYRKIEHYLQLMNDKQTHQIPTDSELLEKMSIFLNFSSGKEFNKELKINRQNVRKVYNSILQVEKTQDVFFNFEGINFTNITKAKSNYKYLQFGMGVLQQKKFDRLTIERFKIIEPAIFDYLKKTPQPDKVLDNFTRLIKNVTVPSLWYKQFANNNFLRAILLLSEFSQKAMDMLIQNKSFNEDLISATALQKYLSEDFFQLSPQKIRFYLSIEFALNIIDVSEVSQIFSSYISNFISLFFKLFSKKYNFFVAGLGSFGNQTMGFNSDIDLIIITDEKEKFEKFSSELKIKLKELQLSVFPFKIDLRLRPEGNKGPIAWSLEKYDEYLSKRVRIWELQSFTKLNFVCGKKKLFYNFTNILTNRIKKLNESLIKTEMKKNRDEIIKNTFDINNSFNLRKSQGSIFDIQYIIEYNLLTNPALYKQKIKNNNNNFAEFFIDRKILGDFWFFKKVEFAIQNIFNQKNSIIPKDKNNKILLSEFLKFSSIDKMEFEINKISNYTKNQISILLD